MFVEPLIQIEVVVLLGPEHARESLAMNAALVFAEICGRDFAVELICIGRFVPNISSNSPKGCGTICVVRRRRMAWEPPAGT